MYKYDFPCNFHTQENAMKGVGCSREQFLSHHPPASLPLLCLCLYHLWSPSSLLSIHHWPFLLFSPSLCLPTSPLSPAPALSLPPRSILPPDLPSPHAPPTPGSGSLQGGTDLEKHRDLLIVENERLRQEMRRCEAELQDMRAKPAVPCTGCEHSQVGPGPGRSRGARFPTVTPLPHAESCPLVSHLSRPPRPSVCRRAPSSATSCPSYSWRWRRTKACCQS